jgi:hypothetical protein
MLSSLPRFGGKAQTYAATMCAGLLMCFTSPCHADDCAWSKEQMNNYLAQCAGYDQCALRNRYAQIINEKCGQNASASNSASAPAQSRAPVQPQQNGSSQSSAMSFAPSASASGEKPADRDDYTGQPCVYFTRPAVEIKDGVIRHNTYANDAKVCYKDSLYMCVSGKWQRMRDCPGSLAYQKLQAEVLESSNN